MRHFWPLWLFIAIFAFVMLIPNAEKDNSLPQTNSSQRIISIAPSITESLFALGLGDQVVAVSDYCDFPEQVAQLPKIGGFDTINIEAIVALQPDLVVVLDNQLTAISLLSRLNIKTITIRNDSIADIQSGLIEIGKQTNHDQQALKLVAEMNSTIATITNRTAGIDQPSVMVTIGHSLAQEDLKTIYISGQHDVYNELINLAGGRNVYNDVMARVPSLSLEGVLTLNPDVIIDIFPEADDHNSDINEVRHRWQSLTHLNAAKNDQIHIIEESYATIPGPRITLLLQQFAQIIHPELDWPGFKQ